jgi:hypothetical protein
MSGQVIAVICDEGDGFTLCDDTQGYDYTFKVVQGFLYNGVDNLV